MASPKSPRKISETSSKAECFDHAVPATVAASGLELPLPFSRGAPLDVSANLAARAFLFSSSALSTFAP